MFHKGQLGLYIHWPFCLSKCPYCDFNTHAHDGGIDHGRWQAAILNSLEYYADLTRGTDGQQRVLHSVFFGGGTPSLMPPEMVAVILERVAQLWPQAEDVEISLEANPTSVEQGKFQGFAQAGINRVSLGAQALNDEDLAFLGREHSVAEFLSAYDTARSCFERVSFDLIYARPEQTLTDWSKELSQALELKPKHLSCYQLTIERNTPFYYDHQQGVFHVPEQDLAADFYIRTQEVLERGGLSAYELSNHATCVAEQCRHNLIYWHYDNYIGIGPGAHGRLTLNDGTTYATRDHAAPDIWLERVEGHRHGAHPWDALSKKDVVMERLMMGLRLISGIDLSDDDWVYLDRQKVQVLADQDWLNFSDRHLCLKTEGLLRLNAILPFVFKDVPR